MLRVTLEIFSVALKDFSRNNCSYMAAGIAYWSLLSLFPLILAGISFLGFLYPTMEEQGAIVEAVVQLIPVSVGYLASVIEGVSQARGTLGVVAVIGLLWSGTAVFSAIRKGINHTWHVSQPPYFLFGRAMDLLMLLGVAVLAFTQITFSTNLVGFSSLDWWPEARGAVLALRFILEFSTLMVTAGVLVLLYRYIPNTHVAWGDTWFGASIGSLGFHGVGLAFTWYTSHFSSFNLVYGSLGALMAVLVWAYFSSLAVLLGAQMAYTYSTILGSRRES